MKLAKSPTLRLQTPVPVGPIKHNVGLTWVASFPRLGVGHYHAIMLCNTGFFEYKLINLVGNRHFEQQWNGTEDISRVEEFLKNDDLSEWSPDYWHRVELQYISSNF